MSIKYYTLSINNLTPRNPWVLLSTHIAQLLTYTTNVYIAAAYLAIMLLNLLAYCRG